MLFLENFRSPATLMRKSRLPLLVLLLHLSVVQPAASQVEPAEGPAQAPPVPAS